MCVDFFYQFGTILSNCNVFDVVAVCNKLFLTLATLFTTVAALDLFILNILLFVVIFVVLLAQIYMMRIRVIDSTNLQESTITTLTDCVLLRQQSQHTQLLRASSLRTLYSTQRRIVGSRALKKLHKVI